MQNRETSYAIFLFATSRTDREDQLWGVRTGAFLSGNAFLFVGMLSVLASGLPIWLAVVVAVGGLMLCIVQNRNSWATRRGRDNWERLKNHAFEQSAFEQLDPDLHALMKDVMRERQTGWGILAPGLIQEYWLPGILSMLWIAAGVAPFVG